MRMKNTTPHRQHAFSGIEALESRLCLSASAIFNPPPPYGNEPIWVSPPISDLPLIQLPPGVTAPPDVTYVPEPAFGPILSDFAEQTAADTGGAFLTAHPTAIVKSGDHVSGHGVFIITVTETAGRGISFIEKITESTKGVSVTMKEIDGLHRETLSSHETTPTKPGVQPQGVLVYSVFDHGHRTSFRRITEAHGQTNG